MKKFWVDGEETIKTQIFSSFSSQTTSFVQPTISGFMDG